MNFKNGQMIPLKDLTNRVKVGFVGSCNNDYCGPDNGYPMIRTTNLTNSGINLSNLKYVTKDFYEKYEKSQLHYGDILIARHGNNGLASLWTEKYKAQCLNVVIVETNDEIADKYFLYYMINSIHVQKQLKAMVGGSVQGVVNTKDIADVLIPYYDLDTQRRLVDTLRKIDEKIELNNQINNNLEQLCDIIYERFFVNFGYFNNSNQIPSSFKEVKLKDVVKCELGGTPSRSKEEYWGGNISWINSGKINEFRIITASETITEKGLKSSSTKLLPKKTTVLAITGATLGQVSLLEIDSCANQSVIGVLENDIIPYEYIYPMIKNKINELIKKQTGGAQQHINKGNVESLQILIPDKENMEKYKKLTKSLYETIAKNCFEIDYLTKLRDTLLPKLMSGEIDVSDINFDLN